jgi:hypothetical protein
LVLADRTLRTLIFVPGSRVYLPRTCVTFFLLISQSPIAEFNHQLRSPFFGGRAMVWLPINHWQWGHLQEDRSFLSALQRQFLTKKNPAALAGLNLGWFSGPA